MKWSQWSQDFVAPAQLQLHPFQKFPGSSSAPAPQKSKKLGSSSAQLQELEPAPWNREPGAKNFEPCAKLRQRNCQTTRFTAHLRGEEF